MILGRHNHTISFYSCNSHKWMLLTADLITPRFWLCTLKWKFLQIEVRNSIFQTLFLVLGSSCSVKGRFHIFTEYLSLPIFGFLPRKENLINSAVAFSKEEEQHECKPCSFMWGFCITIQGVAHLLSQGDWEVGRFSGHAHRYLL